MFTLRPKPATDLPPLSDRDFIILSVLQGNVRQGLYGSDIREAVAAEYGQRIPLGSLYVTLARLVEKGFAERVEGEAVRDDLRRQYYRITPRGAQARASKLTLLEAARSAMASR